MTQVWYAESESKPQLMERMFIHLAETVDDILTVISDYLDEQQIL